jgi:SnoaL-like domain
MLDQNEIRDIVYRYCRGIDRCDYDLVRHAPTSDVVLAVQMRSVSSGRRHRVVVLRRSLCVPDRHSVTRRTGEALSVMGHLDETRTRRTGALFSITNFSDRTDAPPDEPASPTRLALA